MKKQRLTYCGKIRVPHIPRVAGGYCQRCGYRCRANTRVEIGGSR